MRTYIILLFAFVVLGIFLPSKVMAENKPLAAAPAILLSQTTGAGSGQVASDGAWLTDPDVTFAGKTASRSASLFNWVLVNYKWSYGDNTLAQFWVKIRNIVYAFLVLVVIITAFTMIITGGQSITAVQFLRKFLVVILLITLSFALIRFFYQIVDIITGFFVRNPDGDIISSRDLFNMSFGYENFVGWRRYGPSFDESAFVSLLLVKITAVTYYVMAGILIVRKIILWFFITVSPIYPILLLYFPIRNTAKIWLGEFFRWLLYAPLFTIFLSGLVYLYRDDINVLPFNFKTKPIVYPTAINILLGGPGQKLDISNSVNYTDTFAEYVIALIMVWVVIFLPFLLLRIFLDYLSNISINKDMAIGYMNNALGYVVNKDRLLINNPSSGGPKSPPPLIQPGGTARQLPFGTGAAKNITYNTVSRPTYTSTAETQNRPVNTQNTYNRPRLKSERISTETLKLTNLPIPTMHDIARYETSRLTNQTSTHQEVNKMHDVLQKISNPYAIPSSIDREHFTAVREKLFQAKLKGDQVASSILNAASNVTTINQQSSNRTQTNNYQKHLHETIQKLANPATITSATERQQFTTIKEKLIQESKQGNVLATSILNASHNTSVLSEKSLHETLEKIANPESLPSTEQKQKFTQLKEKLISDSKSGDPVATTVLNNVNAISAQKHEQAGAKGPSVSLPAVNQVQTVNLDDYENVKKMWTENYHKISVPKTIDKPNRTREEWIKNDLGTINRTISLLISTDQQKVNEGMKMVSNILPFLLMGGFSQTEVIAYLKAKEVAGEAVLKDLTGKAQEESETEVEVTKHKIHAQKHLTQQMEEQLPDEGKPEKDSNGEIKQREILVPVGAQQQTPAKEDDEEESLLATQLHHPANQNEQSMAQAVPEETPEKVGIVDLDGTSSSNEAEQEMTNNDNQSGDIPPVAKENTKPTNPENTSHSQVPTVPEEKKTV